MDARKVKKFVLNNLAYVIFGYAGNIICFAFRTAEGKDISDKILPALTNLGTAFAHILPSFNPIDLLFGVVVGVAMKFIMKMRAANRKKFRQGTEYGSAVWGEQKDIEPYMDLKDKDNNVILTQTEYLTMGKPSSPKYARNKNILVIGGSGSGKTRFFVKPNLMQMHSSYIVTDPKGTVLIECGKMLEQGRPVKDDNGRISYDSINDACMYGYYEKYYWKTECNLYYNVKQKKTFDEVIEDKLKSQSHKDERLEYYKLLSGKESGSETLYGNHQTLRNMLSGDTIRNYSVKQAFGYDMWKWNSANDGLYQGIKYYCDNGADLYAPFDCEIKSVDTNDNKITLRKDDVEYWYDGSGGTDRDTEVTITNAELLSGFSEGDKIKEGEKFARTTYTNVNFHIEIDTDGYGWDYIDPRLVLY